MQPDYLMNKNKLINWYVAATNRYESQDEDLDGP